MIQSLVLNVHVDTDRSFCDTLLLAGLKESLAGHLADGVIGAIIELVVAVRIGTVVADAQTAVNEVQNDTGCCGFFCLRHGRIDRQCSCHDRIRLLCDSILKSSDVLFCVLLTGRSDDVVIDLNAQLFFHVDLGLFHTCSDLCPEIGLCGRCQISDVILFCFIS